MNHRPSACARPSPWSTSSRAGTNAVTARVKTGLPTVMAAAMLPVDSSWRLRTSTSRPRGAMRPWPKRPGSASPTSSCRRGGYPSCWPGGAPLLTLLQILPLAGGTERSTGSGAANLGPGYPDAVGRIVVAKARLLLDQPQQAVDALHPLLSTAPRFRGPAVEARILAAIAADRHASRCSRHGSNDGGHRSRPTASG